MSQHLAVCKSLGRSSRGTSSHEANLAMLEEDLDVHQGQPEDLQIDIERTGLELEACYATQAAEEEQFGYG